MQSFQSVEDDLHIISDSSFACSSSSSSSSSSSLSSPLVRSRPLSRDNGMTKWPCSYCGLEYARLAYPYDTCTPECALTFCSDSALNFNAVYANLRSRFSGPTDYYPCPIPGKERPREGEERTEYEDRCTTLCYGEGRSHERSVRQNALQYALSSDLHRK